MELVTLHSIVALVALFIYVENKLINTEPARTVVTVLTALVGIVLILFPSLIG